MECLGAGLAYLVAGLSVRQTMWFYCCSTIKTVDDHCGYAFPWDPLQHLTSNNAAYHDIHHQTWGIKTNFSQPFFTFWDGFMGTKWVGGNVSLRYEKTRAVTSSKASSSNGTIKKPVSVSESEDVYSAGGKSSRRIAAKMPSTASPTIPEGKATQQSISSREQVLEDKQTGGVRAIFEESMEEKNVQKLLKRTSRKKSLSTASQTAGLKSLHDRVYDSLHGRGGSILGLESNRG
jgi:sphinganine C4-monooxygenase